MPHLPTVLIIEDDPVFRRVLSFTVAKFGLAVEVANDGQFGFERLMEGGIDFIVTDHQMPRCGGVELLTRLQECEGYQRPPTILCTAKGLELDSEALRREFNVIAVMHKPFSPRQLGELISDCLQQPSATSVDEEQSPSEKSNAAEGKADRGAVSETGLGAGVIPSLPMANSMHLGPHSSNMNQGDA